MHSCDSRVGLCFDAACSWDRKKSGGGHSGLNFHTVLSTEVATKNLLVSFSVKWGDTWVPVRFRGDTG